MLARSSQSRSGEDVEDIQRERDGQNIQVSRTSPIQEERKVEVVKMDGHSRRAVCLGASWTRSTHLPRG